MVDLFRLWAIGRDVLRPTGATFNAPTSPKPPNQTQNESPPNQKQLIIIMVHHQHDHREFNFYKLISREIQNKI